MDARNTSIYNKYCVTTCIYGSASQENDECMLGTKRTLHIIQDNHTN